MTVAPGTPPALAWSWSYALLGAIYAAPAAGVVLADPLRGIALAIGVLLGPPPAVIAVSVVATLAALAATKGSHRYVTPMFTTFLVFLLLLVDSPQQTAGRFLERMGETLLGVALAVVFGLVVPALLARRNPSAASR